MTTRAITTTRPAVACDVCGRNLLRGERSDVFLAGGSRRNVCELCVARATNEGWLREGDDSSVSMRPRYGQRGRTLLGRLRQQLRTPAPGEEDSAPGSFFEDHGPDGGHHPAPEGDPYEHESAGPAAATGPATPTGREPRSVRAVPTNADLKVARALEVFNLSRHPRTVAGVARSLGPPIVSARPAEIGGSVVSIVVGWELCWYRYEVDLADEAAGVMATGQGDELEELDERDRSANAAADERGELALSAA